MKLKNNTRNSLIKNLENIQLVNLKEYYFNKENDDFILSIFNELNDLLLMLKEEDLYISSYNKEESLYTINNINLSFFNIVLKKNTNKRNQYILYFDMKNNFLNESKSYTLINVKNLLNNGFSFENNFKFHKICNFCEFDSSIFIVIAPYIYMIIICCIMLYGIIYELI